MKSAHVLMICSLVLPSIARAQDHSKMDHSTMHKAAAKSLPTLPGQDAYAAIAEVVRLLQADSTTDWSRANLEGLRAHLLDMNLVTLQTRVQTTRVPGGVQLNVTGDAATADAIRRMTKMHGAALADLGIRATSESIPSGARFTVTAADTSDTAMVAQLRGLGFAGIMVLGNHHAAHHLAIARGEGMQGHGAH
ncbi:MAG: hypothetical protein ABIT38_23045 [Gemmatimonadaceae bacterium]